MKKTSTVVKQFVVDYTTETFEPLMEYEVNGFDYRYVYGNDRLSVDIKGVTTSSDNIIENGDHIRLYYHMDYLGTADYLTSPVSGKITSWTHYNEWGEITHNAVLKCGQRQLDLVKRYATHDYDSVLGMYYAKARFYDAELRRFDSVDPVKGFATDPTTMVQYLYVKNSPLIYVDENGEIFSLITGAIGAAIGGIVSGVTTAVKTYKETGKVDLSKTAKSALKGAVVGGIIGLTAGMAATAVAGMAATTTISTASALSTAAVVTGSKAAAAFAIGSTVVASSSAGRDIGTTGKVNVPKTIGKGTLGGLTGLGTMAVAPIATALSNASSIGGAATAIIAEATMHPVQTQNTVMTGLAEALSLASANMALENEDYLSAIMHIAFAGAYMEPFTGCSASTAQSLTDTISAQNNPVSNIGWHVGDPIDNLTSKGNTPSWTTVRNRYWKNEAYYNPEGYSSSNLTRMMQGSPPQRVNPITGELESMELHHTYIPQREGTENGLWNLTKLWPDEHAAVDEFRHLGG